PSRQRGQGSADLADRLVAAVEGGAEYRHHADRVLVAMSYRLGGGQVEAITFHRHQSWLHIPIAAELVPAHLHVDAEDEVWPVCRLAGRLHPLAPEPLQREATEHRRLARSGR